MVCAKGDTTLNCNELVHRGTRGKRRVHFQPCQPKRMKKKYNESHTTLMYVHIFIDGMVENVVGSRYSTEKVQTFLARAH